jgi:hypothetical protein
MNRKNKIKPKFIDMKLDLIHEYGGLNKPRHHHYNSFWKCGYCENDIQITIEDWGDNFNRGSCPTHNICENCNNEIDWSILNKKKWSFE